MRREQRQIQEAFTGFKETTGFGVGAALGMPGRRAIRRGLEVLAVVVVAVAVGWGQDGVGGRAARLTLAQGQVSVLRSDNTGSDPAERNMPLAEGAQLATGQDGQAEVEFEDGSLVRLTPNSSLTLTRLGEDDAGLRQTTILLVYGLAYAELRAATQYGYSFEAGSMRIAPTSNATFRVDADESPATVAVFDGTVHVRDEGAANLGGYSTDVRAGEALRSDATDGSRYLLSQEIAPDTWDQWNDARDKSAAEEASRRTTARDSYAGEAGYGWSDLDANGTWYDVPGQGEVWQPDVASQDATTFDPYGSGAWIGVGAGGYVWASAYAWGWTPYRCGSWSYWGGFGWGWSPGTGCGTGRWGLAGVGYDNGYSYNIAQAPAGYVFRPLPGGGWRGGVHPVEVVRPVRTEKEPVGRSQVQGPKMIAGQKVVALHPVGSIAAAGGAGLQRDFPVDKESRQPVMGRVAEGSAVRAAAGGAPERGAVKAARAPYAGAVAGKAGAGGSRGEVRAGQVSKGESGARTGTVAAPVGSHPAAGAGQTVPARANGPGTGNGAPPK